MFYLLHAILILICCLSFSLCYYSEEEGAVKISFGAVSLLEAVFRKMLDETVLDTTSEEAVPDTPPPPHLNLLQVAPPLSMKKADALRAKTKVESVKVALNIEEVTDTTSSETIDKQLVDDSWICQPCACASDTIPDMDLETESSISGGDQNRYR